MWILYYINGAPGESPDVLSGFEVEGTSVTLAQLRAMFPAGPGHHFRTRIPDKTFGYCWLDLTTETARLQADHSNRVYVQAHIPDAKPPAGRSRLRRRQIDAGLRRHRNWARAGRLYIDP